VDFFVFIAVKELALLLQSYIWAYLRLQFPPQELDKWERILLY